ncbi:MAG: hypothetical protein HZC14_00710 [Candidatus Niyogibacteria bacterium]|nr:hypothetical protein [Candidatus Niyogibacteria bacterium]
MDIFKIIGAIGVLFIVAAVLLQDRRKQNMAFIVAGALLEVYSIYIGDTVFIVLEVVFIAAAVYECFNMRRAQPSSLPR